MCPGRQRRRGARRHPRRRARPVPRAGQPVRRAARREPATTPSRACGPHTRRRGRGGASTPSTTGRTCTCGVLGRRLVFAADEYYLLAGRPFPRAEAYEGFPMHEDGIGMARTFELEFTGAADRRAPAPQAGFFAWVDGAGPHGPATRRPATTTRRPRATGRSARHAHRVRRRCATGRLHAPSAAHRSAILTGAVRRRVLEPLVDGLGRDDVRVRPGARTVLRRQHRRHRADGRRGPRPGARRRARGPPLPAARRVPVRRPVPRRHHARRPAPPVEVVATDGARPARRPCSADA